MKAENSAANGDALETGNDDASTTGEGGSSTSDRRREDADVSVCKT